MADVTPTTNPDRNDQTSPEQVLIETGNESLEIVLVQQRDSPLRLLRWGSREHPIDLPDGQPVVEIVTADSGHHPANSRISAGAVSARLRYSSHDESVVDGRRILAVRMTEIDGTLAATLRIETPATGTAARSTVTVQNDDPTDTRVVLSVTSLAMRVALGERASTLPDDLVLSSARNEWLGESRWTTTGLRAAGVADLALAAHGEGNARSGLSTVSTGTWSTGRYLPAGVIQTADAAAGRATDAASDETTGAAADAASAGSKTPTALAWQIEHNGAWRWEIAEDRQGTSLALSGPTEIDHQWVAKLRPGQWFTSVPVTIAVGIGLEGAVAALTDFRRQARRSHPDNDSLGVVFNDYMNTLMGDPTTEKLLPLIDAASEAGAEYFMIDAGWYDDGGDWWSGVGEWKPSTVRFPGGFGEVIDHVRSRDMIPGLWLEPEVVGVDSPAALSLPAAAFFTRHGERIVEHGRYHLDLRHPAAIAHLDEVIDRLVTGFGVGYFKFDYNINPGPGTDIDSDSPGDGLLQHNRAHLAWLDSVLDRHPSLVIENCGSGAMRMDFAMLSRLQLQSTSDQQDAEAYAPIAASAPLMVLPEQAANWAYPQSSMTDEHFAFTLCTGILGRMYLSGYLDRMSMSQQVLVAEAVAAHKRLRHDLAAGHASWPLGIDQWSSPWVALAIGTRTERHLTLWKRNGAERTVQIPLPDLVGTEVSVETVFPARLEPWNFDWNAVTGILSVTAHAEASARTIRISAGTRVERVAIDASASTGEVHGGATGMLYGLGDPGVPAQSVITGVRPRTMAQKSPGGKQHPNGDAVEVSADFFAAGGAEMVVYMQDALEQWPYEDLGIDAYLAIAREMVVAVTARPDSQRFVWVPFNEGDWIWYPDWRGSDKARFLDEWAQMVRMIRGVDPSARIVGPNESHYLPGRVRDFFVYCLENDVMPDIMSWHELQPSSLEVYRPHYEHYRALERELDFGPLPINIDEYGNRRDMSNPGQLVQWIEMFESTKVDADLAYWTLAGNLDDHAVNSRQANAGWWVLNWYAGLRGHTVAATVPNGSVRDSLRALAAVDDAQTLTVMVGGGSDAIALDISGLAFGRDPVSATPFSGPARVKVSTVTWSGYEGDVAAVPVLRDDTVTVEGGRLTVEVPNTDPMAAYLVQVTPDGGGEEAPLAPWTRSWNTDDATLTDCETLRHGDDPQHYSGVGRRGVSAMALPTSSVAFDIEVPQDGDYLLGLTYATDSRPGRIALVIDEADAAVLELPATFAKTYAGRVDHPVTLAAGPHLISLQTSVAGAPVEDSDIAVDRISLARITGNAQRLDAVVAWRSEGAVAEFTEAVHGPGRVRLPAGESLTFVLGTAARDRHELVVTGQAASASRLKFLVDGREVADERMPQGPIRLARQVALPTGISIVTLEVLEGDVDIDSLQAAAIGVDTAEPIRIGADEFTLHGGAVLGSDADQHFVHELGENQLSPNGTGLDGNPGGSAMVDLPALAPGEYLLTLTYSNADRRTGHLYNADVISRGLQVRRGTDAPTPVLFRHNYSWSNFQELSVAFAVTAASGPLVLEGLSGPGPRVASVELEPLVLRPSSPGSTT